MRRACSPFEAWGAWPRSRFAALTSNCLKDNQTNAIDRKKLLRLVSARFLCVRTKRIFYLLSFPDVLNANGSRSYYSPLKAGSPAPFHNPLARCWPGAHKISKHTSTPASPLSLDSRTHTPAQPRISPHHVAPRPYFKRPPLSPCPPNPSCNPSAHWAAAAASAARRSPSMPRAMPWSR